MKIFVTGASGFVGAAVVKDLVDAGHRVIGLARSAAAAGTLSALGAEAHAGSLEDRDSLRSGIASADAVVHTAFNHDFSRFRENCEADRDLIAFYGEELNGSDRPIIVTSAIGILPNGETVTEATMPATGEAAHLRAATEAAARQIADEGVNVMVVRLSPSVHGAEDHAFVPTLIRTARQTGVSAYIGEGGNTWPAVHRLDAARLYRLALENGQPGAVYHAVGEEGIPFRDIATAIGEGCGLPVVSKTPNEASDHFGWFTHFAGMNLRASSARTGEALGWSPDRPGLITDMALESYFGSMNIQDR
ncbi:SDR family oxidoreductase [Paroceanicella profunda]|uniref:SDR family oxidoreductase n=1 Tax=Paroceanicella profunda TaxID=2579971 RepID=A0A5B8G0B9_9RHOB|nr:SDR family oxidoreductase [Paroceanicella profunda]QDL93160.1 SDR family oxidoreductase [Paroceanicella profunda]